MRTRQLAWVPALLLAACQGGEIAQPSTPPAQVPSLAISDGAHSAGNVDFFFLPPVVIPTAALTNWTHDGFNGALSPSVEICRLVATTAAQVATVAGSQCNGSPVVISGPAVKKHFPPLADPTDAITGLPGDWAHYHAKWPIPSTCTASFFYRVRVKVGAVELGFADVQCITSIIQLLTLDYRKFGPAIKGTTLQIPFRVERYALCPVPGVGPCGTATIPLSTGGHVEFPGSDGHTVGAVTIPAQTPTSPDVTVTIQPCAGGASLPIDLPKFGGCVSVTTDPAGLELTNAATVEICNLGADLDLSGLTPAQKARVTLHRQSTDLTVLQALPHVAGCAADAAVNYSVGGFLRELVHGDFHRAGLQLFGLVAPQPLNALDVGAGGLTFDFSNFQFALPSKIQILLGDGQTVPPGTLVPVNPTVLVTDLMGDPVRNATVNFAASAGGSIGAASVLTGADGQAAVTWTVAAAPGPNSLVASGRGIADPVHNGPRSTFDPFMSIQSAFNPSAEVIPNPLQPVDLLTGAVTFTATGVYPGDPLPINYGSAGWSYQIDGEVPTDWFSNPVTPFESVGPGGFGENHDACSLIGSGTQTTWPAGNTVLWVRRNISLPTTTTIQISVAIDNDVEIYVDGVNQGPGLLVHDNCPTQGSFVRTISLPAGTHVVAFKAIDRGGSSYFDASITIPSF